MFSMIATFKRNRLKVLRAVSKAPKPLSADKYPELSWAIKHRFIVQRGDWSEGTFIPDGTYQITEQGIDEAIDLANKTWSNRRSWISLTFSAIAILISLIAIFV